MFVSGVQGRVVEGSQVGSRGCVVHVDVHGELCCRLLQWSCYTESGIEGLSCLYAGDTWCSLCANYFVTA